jgi:hypothetical protein
MKGLKSNQNVVGNKPSRDEGTLVRFNNVGQMDFESIDNGFSDDFMDYNAQGYWSEVRGSKKVVQLQVVNFN